MFQLLLVLDVPVILVVFNVAIGRGPTHSILLAELISGEFAFPDIYLKQLEVNLAEQSIGLQVRGISFCVVRLFL